MYLLPYYGNKRVDLPYIYLEDSIDPQKAVPNGKLTLEDIDKLSDFNDAENLNICSYKFRLNQIPDELPRIRNAFTKVFCFDNCGSAFPITRTHILTAAHCVHALQKRRFDSDVREGITLSNAKPIIGHLRTHDFRTIPLLDTKLVEIGEYSHWDENGKQPIYKQDYAVIEVPGACFDPMPLSNQIDKNEIVAAIGYPSNLNNTAVISFGRINIQRPNAPLRSFMVIHDGFSGGPLITLQGKCIGINFLNCLFDTSSCPLTKIPFIQNNNLITSYN